MAYTTNSTVTLFNANYDFQSLPPGPTLKENVKNNLDLSRLRAFIDAPPMDKGTPSNLMPGVLTLGSTYNVLNGNYADPNSAVQQVINWNKSDVRIQDFGPNSYSIYEAINYNAKTDSFHSASYGKTATEYTKSLSVHAGFDASFPGFSASASVDYDDSQRENLSNAFTRITSGVTHYTLSLPPTSQIRSLLKSYFVDDLKKMDPIALYKEYGTHLLRSLTVGGRALFLTVTDTRSYSSELSVEAAAKIHAQYVVASGNMELSAKQREAMDSFNQSSETRTVTRGGNPMYGDEEFPKNVAAWKESTLYFPVFVDFGSLPCFTGLWEFASTPERRDVLQKAYAQFVTLYAQDLTAHGPFLRARLTQDFDSSKSADVTVVDIGHFIKYNFPRNLASGWYYISPGVQSMGAVIVTEMVPGALAPVKWEEIFVAPGPYSQATRFWRAIPPTLDYIAMGVVAVTASSAAALPSQPPASLVGSFRAVHKRTLTAAVTGATWQSNYTYENRKFFSVDNRYWFADMQLPPKLDCFRLDPKGAILEGDGW
ncbi:MAC/Perforin domain-containing protein [Cytidiella melzeri]|nr:MAC/Perforin domain-containing protein [Cytidiella melzeri]